MIKDLTTGINEGNGHLLFNVYPHPVTDILYVTVRNTEPSEIMLYDIFARQILQQTFTNSTTIKTEQLADGIYFYKLRNSDDKIESGKIIKQ
ncbi:MAG: T9SS type A sorting domain-containing protein [Sphingobacteriales bacterium]|nr:T9SS type A sorting domain-containing protein [Sphingobacteriales bacterium]MBK6888516.1 T9SS type A sorting domain-containing protein [Sphingobacteriales bacterium]